jgi:acetylornithine deacetylase
MRAVSPTVDPGFVGDLLEAIVRIPSVNPSLVPGAPGEAGVARHLAAACERLGMRVTVEAPAPSRPNVVAVLPGTDPGAGSRLLLNGHMDTVGVSGMDAPFEPRRQGDRLYGRGAYDMKGSLAAMVGAVAAIRAAGMRLRGEVILTFVADEEHLSLGTAALAGSLRAHAAIVTEPTALRICVAHKGFAWATIRTEGRAAHGSDHVAGVDAIMFMGRVLEALERFDREVLARRIHPLLGRASLHASTIQGGEGWSTYPPSCVLGVERRTLPHETGDGVRAELEGLLGSLAHCDPRFRASLEMVGERPGLQVEPRAPIVQTLHRACTQVLGADPEEMGAAYWCDAALLAAAGVPTVVFGPSGEGAHARVEYVDLPSVIDCARVLAGVIAAFCEPAS